MQNVKSVLYLLISVFILNSCKKNDGVGATNTEPTYNDAETVTASITGTVVNENNQPVQGATVYSGANTLTTDINGMFQFRNIPVSKNNGYVKVTRAGYFNGNRSFLTIAGQTNTVRIRLLPKTNTGTFSASAGGTISLSTGGRVVFPANAITDAAGGIYSGMVKVAMAWINPMNSDLGSIIEGDLRGITTDGYERVLETYGMLGVELTNSSGQVVRIATGKTAKISMPIPVEMQAIAPASIPLWYFDEAIGRWKEEGSAARTGNEYTGSVSHFSFWNCDVSRIRVKLNINLVDQNHQPLIYSIVWIKRKNYPLQAIYNYTDSVGDVNFSVPVGELYTLDVLGICGTAVYSQNIGPFIRDSSLNIVATIVPSNVLTITGKLLNCNNQPVSNGAVVIYTGVATYKEVKTGSGGVFTATLINNCSGPVINFAALPVDNTTLQQGLPVTGSGTTGVIDLGNLQACGTNAFQFINYSIDGVPYNYSLPNDSMSSFSQSQSYPFSFYNLSDVWHSGADMNSGMVMGFYYNSNSGTYPISQVSISSSLPNPLLSFSANQITSINPQVNLTVIGTAVSGFLEGNFNINMLFQPGSVVKNVVCSFRVRRPM